MPHFRECSYHAASISGADYSHREIYGRKWVLDISNIFFIAFNFGAFLGCAFCFVSNVEQAARMLPRRVLLLAFASSAVGSERHLLL